MRHRRQSVALLALLPFAALGQESHVLTWCHDGVDVGSFRVYAGQRPEFTGMRQIGPELGSAARTAALNGLPNGEWYFAVTAVSPPQPGTQLTVESEPSNISPEGTGTAVCEPGPVENLVVTAVQAPTVVVSLTAAPEAPAWNEWFLTISAAQSVRISLLGTTRFDWVRQGAQPGGAGGTAIATTPSLGTDEDGVLAQTITLTGPINGARADMDGATFGGANVTVGPVAKPLVRSGSTWSVSFP